MKKIELISHKTRYCIGCRREHEHFWNNNQREFECKQCGLLALDEEHRPNPTLIEFFEGQGVDFSRDTVILRDTGTYKILRNTHRVLNAKPDE